LSYLGRGASLSDLLLGIHTELFGFQEFRVPILTTSPGRVEDLIEVNKRFNNGEGSELFLFADRVSLCASLHVLEHLGSMDGVNE
jgi:hypothetical protein